MAETKKFCIHSDGLGYCDILSDDTVHHYCVEGPCPHEKIVEYAPVKHGRWIPLEYDGYADGFPVWDLWECSQCQEEHSGDEDTLTPYCPNCGCKMDLEG